MYVCMYVCMYYRGSTQYRLAFCVTPGMYMAKIDNNNINNNNDHDTDPVTSVSINCCFHGLMTLRLLCT